jgi:hypothetical protein
MLYALTGIYFFASLAHFAHNALFIDGYPNLPSFVSARGVWVAWIAITCIGAAGVWAVHRGSRSGLWLLLIYAILGWAGLDHYWLAPVSAHSLAMNASIWAEAATAACLTFYVGYLLRGMPRVPG